MKPKKLFNLDGSNAHDEQLHETTTQLNALSKKNKKCVTRRRLRHWTGAWWSGQFSEI